MDPRELDVHQLDRHVSGAQQTREYGPVQPGQSHDGPVRGGF
jgi:hypothetical protein